MEFEPSKEDLEQLREWLRKMPHLVQDYDDNFLAALVRAKKGSLQKTKACIENINSLGMEYPDFLSTYDPLYPPLQEAHQAWLTFPLPKKTPEGFTVIFTCSNPKSEDPSKSNMQELPKYLLLVCYVLLWENEFGSGKWKLVLDLKGFSLAHIKNITPMTVMRMMKIAESNIPLRIHSVNGFNVAPVMEHFLYLFKLAARKKMADRIFFYSSKEKLTETLPQKMLPKEYGGSEESVLVLFDNWRKKLESYRQRFLEEEQKMRKLDTLRPRRVEEDEMIGTFRQLTVD